MVNTRRQPRRQANKNNEEVESPRSRKQAGRRGRANEKPSPVKKGTKAKNPKPTRQGKKQQKQDNRGRKGGKKAPPKREEKKAKTAEELDREMDEYMMKDEKVALKKLDEEMDAYKAEAEKKKPVGESGKIGEEEEANEEAVAEEGDQPEAEEET